jgi:hypothetical protein
VSREVAGQCGEWFTRGHLSCSQQFNEIMPCIYSQFMEKEARQWRQIYKVCHDMVVRLAQLDSL